MKKILQFILVIFVVTLISSSSIVIAGPADEINFSTDDTFIMEVTEFSYTGSQIFWDTGAFNLSNFVLPSAFKIEITESDVGKLIYYQIGLPTLGIGDHYESIEIKYSPNPTGLAGSYGNFFTPRMGNTEADGSYFFMLNSQTLLLKNNWVENEANFNSSLDDAENMVSYSIINNDDVFRYNYNIIRENTQEAPVKGNFTDIVTYEYDKASGVINYIEYDITNAVLGVAVHLLYTRVSLTIDGVATSNSSDSSVSTENTDKQSEANSISFDYVGVIALLVLPMRRISINRLIHTAR